MDEQVPSWLMLAAAVLVKFVVDAVPDKAPSWVKVALSVAVSWGITRASCVDLFSQVSGADPSELGYAITGLVVAAMASKAVHPVVEAFRALA